LAADEISTPKVIITEVRPGGDVVSSNGTDFKEYITLYNQSGEDINDLSGWTFEYAKTTFDPLYCGSANWENSYENSPVNTIGLSGGIPSGSAVTFNTDNRSINDNISGSIRLVDDSGMVEDLVGWGADSACYENLAEPAVLSNGESLQRYIKCDTGLPIDNDDNSTDFVLSETPGPGRLAGPLTAGCSGGSSDDGNTNNNQNNGGNSSNGNEDSGGLGGGPQNSCEGVIISELLANPAGSDSGKEFIELYNPTNNTIALVGCKLQTSDSSKMYEFTAGEIKPAAYKAFYNDVTGLTLTNSGGGTVYVIDTDGTEIYQADYAPSLGDDVSWSLIKGNWVQTFSLTPDKPNESLTLKPCPAGQFRNPETNRCNNILEEAAGLGPCAPGKERNPDTHRCRNIISLATTLKACAEDQYRNPSTNRCRKYSSASLLKPCQPGQERNPETNRCRKSTSSSAAGGINDVKDVLSSTALAGNSNWSFAIFSVIGAFSYGLWEWRSEILQKLSLLKANFS
jgi:hypothetical protein